MYQGHLTIFFYDDKHPLCKPENNIFSWSIKKMNQLFEVISFLF